MLLIICLYGIAFNLLILKMGNKYKYESLIDLILSFKGFFKILTLIFFTLTCIR